MFAKLRAHDKQAPQIEIHYLLPARNFIVILHSYMSCFFFENQIQITCTMNIIHQFLCFRRAKCQKKLHSIKTNSSVFQSASEKLTTKSIIRGWRLIGQPLRPIRRELHLQLLNASVDPTHLLPQCAYLMLRSLPSHFT